MGRLFQWIQSAASVRGSHGRDAMASRRRRLAFERCESRIALSAAEGDLVQFADGANFVVAADQYIPIEDGGSITLAFTAGDSVNWSAIKNQFDSIAVGSLINGFTIRGESMVTLVQGMPEASTRQVIGDWDYAFTDSDAAFAGIGRVTDDAFDLISDGDYGMSLGEPELSSPSINSDLSVIPTPTPSEQPGGGNENEGGQIALTPFVAPTGLTLSDGYGSSSIARAKPTLEELRETPTARGGDSGRLEGIRGRAVVYEVADASGVALPPHSSPDDESTADRDAVALVSFNDLAPAGISANASRATENSEAAVEMILAADSSSDEEAALAAASVRDLKAPGDLTLNGDAVESPSLNGGPVADRDEAFSDWPTAESLDSQAAALAAPQGDRDRRMLGIGLALALSFKPLRKVLQRRGEQPTQQELPRRRRIS
jgi:hypothetical protein